MIGSRALCGVPRFFTTKLIIIEGQTVKLFSLNGKLWCSRPADFRLFKQRRRQSERRARRMVLTYVPDKLFSAGR